MALSDAFWWDQPLTESSPVVDHQVMKWIGHIVQDDMQSGQHPPLQHLCQRVELRSHSVTGFADQSDQSVRVSDPGPAAPAHQSIQDGTGQIGVVMLRRPKICTISKNVTHDVVIVVLSLKIVLLSKCSGN